MTPRKLTLALSIVALVASGNALAAEFNFLKPGQVELTKLVPPPPPLGSEAEKQDMAGVLDVQKTRTPEQSKRELWKTTVCQSISTTTCSDRISRLQIFR